MKIKNKFKLFLPKEFAVIYAISFNIVTLFFDILRIDIAIIFSLLLLYIATFFFLILLIQAKKNGFLKEYEILKFEHSDS